MPSPVPLRIVLAELKAKGYLLHRISGSHHYFKCPGKPSLSIPVHGNKVKYGYYKRIQEIAA